MAQLPALPYVRAGLTQGLSANAAYREYLDLAHQADAVGLRRQDFLRLYSQTARLRGQAPEAMAAPKNIPNGGLEPVRRDTQQARGYGYWVSIFQRERGGSDFISMPYLVKSSVPMTPEEAEARAHGYLTQQPDTYNRTLLGLSFVGVEEFVPPGAQ